MPVYAYHAVDAAGRSRRGRYDAATSIAATRALETSGLLLLDLSELPASDEHTVRLPYFRRRQSVLAFTRGLSSLLTAGLTLGRALSTTELIVPAEARALVRGLRVRVERGDSLHSALTQYPAIFPPVYTGMVRAGENAGDLAGAFRRLVTHLEREAELRSKLAGACVYPIFLVCAGTIALATVFLFVLPRFRELLDGAGAGLPATTTALLAFADFTTQFWGLVPALGILAVLFLLWHRVSVDAQRIWSRTAAKLPGISSLREAMLAARFARMMQVLLEGGSPMLAALDVTARSTPDLVARDEVERIRDRVREGAILHRTMRDSRAFPPLLEQLVAVGEESSRLGEFFGKAADHFEDEGARRLQRIAAAAEPVLIVVFGAVIGFVALSLLQAVYGINAGAFR